MGRPPRFPRGGGPRDGPRKNFEATGLEMRGSLESLRHRADFGGVESLVT